jgi:7-carboxy-7-deazaguanine synthase
MDTIAISEIFGPTIQGEGYHVGYPTVFVRTGGCDYQCAWCDTLYAVLPQYKDTWAKMTPVEIMDSVKRLSNNSPILVTFSGGNPAIQDLEPVIDLGHQDLYTFTMETQGSVPKPWFNSLDYITFSPKPPSSMMKTDWDKLSESLDCIEDPMKVSLKVVVSDEKDYAFALKVFDKYPDYQGFITPCNISPGDPDLDSLYEKTRHVTQMVLDDNRYNVTILPQLHVLLWGNARGR